MGMVRQALAKPPRPLVSADQAILEGDTFIADAGVKAAGAKLRADEIGIVQRAFPVKGGHHFNSQPGFGDHSPRQSGDNLDFLFALFTSTSHSEATGIS